MSVRWGFLGAGMIAQKALAPAVHAADGAVLQAVAARSLDRAAGLEPAGSVYGDYAALLDDPDVDAVYIALANDAHVPWAVRALEAGKHVLCEKPLALDAAQTEEAYAASEKAGRLLVEASWYRWHPRTQRSSSLVSSGAIGEVRSVQTAFCFTGVAEGNYRLDPAMGGGALYDVGHYALSGALWALGESASVVSATARWSGASHGEGVDLVTDAQLAAGPASGEVSCGIDAPDRQALRVSGSAGSVEHVQDAFMSWHAPSSLRLVDGAGEHVEEFAPVDPYRLMVEAVSRRIEGDADAWLLPASESIALARLMDAVREASRGERS
ncbi:MAG: Gfo/Idh/MocA family protein [Motilibacteraceae bacterium]